MTELDWLTCTDPKPMLGFLLGKTTDRQLWLFACGLCRRHAKLLEDPRCKHMIEVGERYADGKAMVTELDAARERAFDLREDLSTGSVAEAIAIAAAFAVVDPAQRDPNLGPFSTAQAVEQTSDDLIHVAELTAIQATEGTTTDSARLSAADAERAGQRDILREVFGNPFRPVTVNLLWLSFKVLKLATTIYEHGAFERMPELASALAEAGCTNDAILQHCRNPGPHARGCWALDVLLRRDGIRTEADWLECTDPTPMLEFLPYKVSNRKLRLFCCGCCRRVWRFMADERSRRAVEFTERFVDGAETEDERAAVSAAAGAAAREASLAWNDSASVVDLGDAQRAEEDRLAYLVTAANVASQTISATMYDTFCIAAWRIAFGVAKLLAGAEGHPAAGKELAAMLRDVVGNPFRPATLDAEAVPPALVALAETIYAERAFHRMAELADALEAAGCAESDILAHCRAPGPHLRGCWGVDLLLGRK
jgi:hypothetical protein